MRTRREVGAGLVGVGCGGRTLMGGLDSLRWGYICVVLRIGLLRGC